MEKKITCVIIDDEPFAVKGLKAYVEKIPYLTLQGVCEDAMELMRLLETTQVDLLFLDIQLPLLTGVEFLKSYPNPPLVIFTTAYDEYALEGYELAVLDYLLKPISFQRFLKSTNKAKEYFELKSNQARTDYQDAFFVKSEQRLEKVHRSDILFIESMQNYIIIHTSSERFIVHMPLKDIKDNLPEEAFVQTHRSYIVAIDKIKSIEGNQLFIPSAHWIPISKQLKEKVLEKIVKNQFLKKKG